MEGKTNEARRRRRRRGSIMGSWNPYRLLLLLATSCLVFESSLHALGHQISSGRGTSEGFDRRVLPAFKETPSGSNITFKCSSLGLCVACLYSEKSDKKYRCSETGYRMPFKCIEMEDGSKKTNSKISQSSRSALEDPYGKAKPHVAFHDVEPVNSGHRNLLDDSSTLEGGLQAYITYRSCIPPVSEEKLSVLGFEGIVLCLLIMAGSVIYFRRKRAVVTLPGVGAGRIQMNSRF